MASRFLSRALLFTAATVGWAVASVIAMLSVALLGYLGISLGGILIWFICVRLKKERAGAVQRRYLTRWLAEQVDNQEEGVTYSERAARRDEATWDRRLRVGQQLGIALMVLGVALFLTIQMI